MSLFNIKNVNQITITLYDKKEEFQKSTIYPYNINSLAGTFNYFGVKIYGNLTNISKEIFFSCILHEIIHLLYLRYVQEKGIQNRIAWFDEGLAQNLSGENIHLLNDDVLKEYLLKHIYNQNKIIPDISFLYKHGNTFGYFVDGATNKYNGYIWSYLMIRYLLKALSPEEFNKIMRSKSEIDVIGKELPSITYNYYKRKLKIK